MFKKYGFELWEKGKDIFLINLNYKTVVRYKSFLSLRGDYEEDIDNLFIQDSYIAGGDFLLNDREMLPFYVMLHKVPFEEAILFARKSFFYRRYSIHTDIIKVLSEVKSSVVNGDKLIRNFFEIFFVDWAEGNLSYKTDEVVKDFWSMVKFLVINPPISFEYYYNYFFRGRTGRDSLMSVKDENAYAYSPVFSKLLKKILPYSLTKEDEKYLTDSPTIENFFLSLALLNKGVKTKKVIGTILKFIEKHFSKDIDRAKVVVELSLNNPALIFPRSFEVVKYISIPVKSRPVEHSRRQKVIL